MIRFRRPRHTPFVRTPTVKRGSRRDLRHGQISSGEAVRLLVMPGPDAPTLVAPWGAHPTRIRVAAGGVLLVRPSIPIVAGATLRKRDPSATRRLADQ